MPENPKGARYIYRTTGVCPAEIHFRLKGKILHELRFVGGGCPGNSSLVSRLLNGRHVDEATALIQGIDCRQGTSCPDQLSMALKAVRNGALQPAQTFRTHVDSRRKKRVILVGNFAGDRHILNRLLENARTISPDAVYCVGNITGNYQHNQKLIHMIRKEGVQAVLGEIDWQYAQGTEPAEWPKMESKTRDYLIRFPQLIRFDLGCKKAIAFYGEYLCRLDGFSDYDSYAVEVNMVCGLTDFMRDETVFPALEAMTPQFEADLILFGQAEKWGHWRIGGKDIIGVGPSWDGERISLGLLESDGGSTQFTTTIIG